MDAQTDPVNFGRVLAEPPAILAETPSRTDARARVLAILAVLSPNLKRGPIGNSEFWQNFGRILAETCRSQVSRFQHVLNIGSFGSFVLKANFKSFSFLRRTYPLRFCQFAKTDKMPKLAATGFLGVVREPFQGCVA
jgi:hypothetical protein